MKTRDDTAEPDAEGKTSMSHTMKELGIDHLGIDERLALFQELWASIWPELSGDDRQRVAEGIANGAGADQVPLTEAQRQELQRRLAAHAAAPNDVIPWEQIKAEALARLQQ